MCPLPSFLHSQTFPPSCPDPPLRSPPVQRCLSRVSTGSQPPQVTCPWRSSANPFLYSIQTLFHLPKPCHTYIPTIGGMAESLNMPPSNLQAYLLLKSSPQAETLTALPSNAPQSKKSSPRPRESDLLQQMLSIQMKEGKV